MKRYNLLYLFIFVYALVACTNEDQPSPVMPENAEVTIDLQMPGLNLPTKSAATDAENRINDLYVLMFTDGSLQTFAKASSVTDKGSSAKKTVKVNLPFVEKAVDLVFLANIGTEGESFLNQNIGGEKDAVCSSMIFECPEQAGEVPPIPMYGECSVAELSSTTSISAVLLRSMAVVKLNMTSSVLNFTLQEVSFHNASSIGKIVPNADALGINQVTKPSIPAGVGENILEMETSTTATFYVPETSEGASGATKAFLIIKGDYEGYGVCYYRLDMLDTEGKPVSLLRNHKYTFTITGVHAIGSSSSSEAAANPASNGVQGVLPATIQITDEASGMNEATTDGEHYLAVNASTFQLPAGSKTEKAVLLKVYTDVPGGWALIDLPDGVSATPASGDPNQVGFTWLWVDTNVVRSSVRFYVKAGTLWKIITINV